MRIGLSMVHSLSLPGVDENHGLAGLPLALVQAGSFIRKAMTSFEEYAQLHRRNLNYPSEVLGTAVDCAVVNSNRTAIWTTWRISMEALDEISRRAIRAVAMLGVGEVPGCLMRRLCMGA